MEVDGVGEPERNPSSGGGVPEQSRSSGGGSKLNPRSDGVTLVHKHNEMDEEEGKEEEGLVFLGSVSFKHLEDGWLRCVETGHELPASEKDSYVDSKACRLYLIDAAITRLKAPFCMFRPHPNFKSKLVCKLTGDTINKSVEHIWRHFCGKKFRNKLGKYSLARKSALYSNDSDKPDFWTPPTENRWDFDDGRDSWESSGNSDSETDDEITSVLRTISEKEEYLDSQILVVSNLDRNMRRLEEKVDDLSKVLLKPQAPNQPAGAIEPGVCSSSASLVEGRPTIREVACQLVNWKREVVATGRAFIEEDPVVVRGHCFGGDDVKVLLDAILVPDTPLTQSSNSADTLGEVGIGGNTVWPKSFTRGI